MKVLNQNVRDVLSSLSEINKIGVIQYPISSIKSESGTVVAFFSTKALGEEEFDSFGIFNISELLQVVNLVQEPSIELNNNVIDIESPETTIRYITTDLGILGDYTKIKPVVLEKTKAVNTVVKFDLSAETFTKIKKASDVFKNLEDFIISSNDGQINLEIGDANTKIKNSNSYKLNTEGEATKDVNININVKNLKIIPNGNYVVEVKYNEAKDAYRVLMSSKDVDTLEFIIGVQS